MASTAPDEELDYAIIGAGPAGLQLAYFLERSGARYAVLERSDAPGAFFRTFPRHRKLISINKVHCGTQRSDVQFRWDWNSLLDDGDVLFRSYTAEYFPHPDALIAYLGDFAARNRLRIAYGCNVTRVARSGQGFSLACGTQDYIARKVVVATGLSEPYVPPIPGIEMAQNYADCDLTPERFADRKVLIIGKGNSAFETADSLIPHAAQIHLVSPNSLRMAWNTHHVGHLRAVNNNLVDTDQLKGQNATIWGELLSIRRERSEYVARVSHIDSAGRIFTHRYDDILCCTGFRMALAPFAPEIMPEMTINGRFPRLTERWESVNVPGLFFAGAITQSRDYKRSSSAFIHGFRYNARALFDMFGEERGRTWPQATIARDPEAMCNGLMERINTTSSLWHQFNFLADVLEITPGKIHHRYDVPVDYFLATRSRADPPALLLTFTHDKPADVRLHVNFSKVPALHPRLVFYRGGDMVSEHHMFEDLEAEWFEERLYIAPLEAYLRTVLEACTSTAPQFAGVVDD